MRSGVVNCFQCGILTWFTLSNRLFRSLCAFWRTPYNHLLVDCGSELSCVWHVVFVVNEVLRWIGGERCRSFTNVFRIDGVDLLLLLEVMSEQETCLYCSSWSCRVSWRHRLDLPGTTDCWMMLSSEAKRCTCRRNCWRDAIEPRCSFLSDSEVVGHDSEGFSVVSWRIKVSAGECVTELH